MTDEAASGDEPGGLDPRLLEILACPDDKGALLYVAAEAVLYNPRLRRAYEIDDGIPVLLIDEARTVDDDAEHDRFVASGVATGAAEVDRDEGADGGPSA